MQYALADRGKQLGFQEAETIDIDLGSSAAVAAKRRVGFEQIAASLEAIERLSTQKDERARALERQLSQLEYEATRAAEQYNTVDPRNRLVAAELERSWNAKLAEVGARPHESR